MSVHVIRDGKVLLLKSRPDGYWADSDGRVYELHDGGFTVLFSPKYIVLPGKVVKLCYNERGLWQDNLGTIWALRDGKASVDSKDRAGVGIFSIDDPELNRLTKSHDYMYSSPAYQFFHSREEADTHLKNQLKQASSWKKILAKPFYCISRVFGGLFWENERTR